MEDKVQNRKWQLTINNPADKNLCHDNIKAILSKWRWLKYWCMCDEVGHEGTYHTHIFLYGNSPTNFITVKNKFPSAHIEFGKGSISENRDYIRKEGKWKGSTKEDTNLPETFEESGEMPEEQQGKRNDLINLYGMIKSGMSNYEILEQNPEVMLHIDKVERVRYVVKQEEYKNKWRDLDVCYCFGAGGVGKTRYVMEKFGYENVYRVTDYKHPFDTYKGQDVIVFEEFRSSLRIGDMLNYLDGYPLDLPCRYNNKIACFTKVFITSNISLNEQYTDVQRNSEETWKAFLRRIHKVQVHRENGFREMTVDKYRRGWHHVDEENIDVPFGK